MHSDSLVTSSNDSQTSKSPFFGWNDVYAAYAGAFDTPVARRKNGDEFSQDARWRMREFAESMYRVQNPVPLSTNEVEDVARQVGLGGMFWPTNTLQFVEEIIRVYCAKNGLPFPTNG